MANREPRRVEDLGGPQEWYESLPVVTKWWFTGALVTTCMGNFGMVSPYKLIWSWELLKDNFEVWRLLTPFLYLGQFSFFVLFSFYMIVSFSGRYEEHGPFNTGGGGGTADYVFCLGCGMIGMLATYNPFVLMLGLPISPLLAMNMLYYVVYLLSKQQPEAMATIYFFQLKMKWVPFAYLALTVLMGNSPWDMVHGYAFAHIYYFLVEVVPLIYQKDVLHTPQFLIEYFGVGQYVPPVPAGGMDRGVGNNVWQAPGRVQPPRDPGAGGNRGGGHNWGGGGRPLGAS